MNDTVELTHFEHPVLDFEASTPKQALDGPQPSTWWANPICFLAIAAACFLLPVTTSTEQLVMQTSLVSFITSSLIVIIRREPFDHLDAASALKGLLIPCFVLLVQLCSVQPVALSLSFNALM